jgi:hypothetical protein
MGSQTIGLEEFFRDFLYLSISKFGSTNEDLQSMRLVLYYINFIEISKTHPWITYDDDRMKKIDLIGLELLEVLNIKLNDTGKIGLRSITEQMCSKFKAFYSTYMIALGFMITRLPRIELEWNEAAERWIRARNYDRYELLLKEQEEIYTRKQQKYDLNQKNELEKAKLSEDDDSDVIEEEYEYTDDEYNDDLIGEEADVLTEDTFGAYSFTRNPNRAEEEEVYMRFKTNDGGEPKGNRRYMYFVMAKDMSKLPSGPKITVQESSRESSGFLEKLSGMWCKSLCNPPSATQENAILTSVEELEKVIYQRHKQMVTEQEFEDFSDMNREGEKIEPTNIKSARSNRRATLAKLGNMLYNKNISGVETININLEGWQTIDIKTSKTRLSELSVNMRKIIVDLLSWTLFQIKTSNPNCWKGIYKLLFFNPIQGELLIKVLYKKIYGYTVVVPIIIPMDKQYSLKASYSKPDAAKILEIENFFSAISMDAGSAEQ